MSSKEATVIDFLDIQTRLFTREDLDFLFDAIDDWETMPGLMRSIIVPYAHLPASSDPPDETDRLRIELEERVKKNEAVKEIRDRKKRGAIIKTKLIYLMDVKKMVREGDKQDGKGNVAPAEDGRAHQESH